MRVRKGATRVGVLMGGLSAEREVSLKTGGAIAEALKGKGYRTVSLDVGKDIALQLRRRRVGIAFVALHGRGGEDGAIQGLLESVGMPYTGSGVLSSALAMDKKYSKWVFRIHRLPTAPFIVLDGPPSPSRLWPFPQLRPPVVVKPTCEGSTIGISIVKKAADLAPALKSAFRQGSEVMVEKYVPGRELTVGVLGDRPLPVVEIVAPGGFYDYRAKYRSASTRYLVPAPLDGRRARRLQGMAVKAHAALGCRGATRVDFRLTPEGKPYILEVNTIPGMTATSLLPKAAAEDGIPFGDLVERILLEAAGTGEREEGAGVSNLYRPARRSRQTVNRKEKVRRRFLSRALAFGVPLLLATAAAAAGFAGGSFGSQWLGTRVRQASVFGLTTLTVKGSRILSEAEVAETSGMAMGESIMAVDLAAVRARLLDHPLIRTASVARQLPAQVVIEIEERTPAAVVRGDREEFIVDHDGRVVAFPPDEVPAGLPCFSGVAMEEGTVTGAGRRDLDDGIAIFREIRSFGFPPLDEVECLDLSRRDDAVLFPAGDGPLVHLGRIETGTRLRRWSQVAADMAEHLGDMDYIDLRARGQVVARPREVPGGGPEGEGGEG